MPDCSAGGELEGAEQVAGGRGGRPSRGLCSASSALGSGT